jgi:NADP-reducing hydrogenase subunit HndC
MENLLKIKTKQESLLKARQNCSGEIIDDYEILVHCNTGHKNHEQELINKINVALKDNNLKVSVKKTGCFAMFNVGTVITIFPSGIVYVFVEGANLDELIKTHFIIKTPFVKHLYKNLEGAVCLTKNHFNFFKKQKIVVTKNIGLIESESIEDYIALGGYFSAYNTVTSLKSEEILTNLKNSGLRGRGGAGFPTHLKWQFAKQQESQEKYIVCNADEGDPGAFMNRALLEGDPHSIIEGMLIAAKTIGANKGFIYIRAEYPLATKMINLGVEKAREHGLLGNNLFGTDFCFDIEVKMGAGAYICGEENALMSSLEGFRGESKPKPPFPTSFGVFGKPTVINNVETLSIVPQIIKNGGEWYAGFGTEKSRGTKTFALSGDIVNPGLIELELGEELSTIIYDIGGGVAGGEKLKLVQLGGPSGGCIPESLLNVKVDYEELAERGAIMGSGSMIVANTKTCAVDFAKFFIEFSIEESCGKCTPCRIGNRRVYELLNKITHFKASLKDLENLKYICNHIKSTSLCGLGQTSTNPVLSTLEHFEQEYINHIKWKRCRAGTCLINLKYEITNKCTGCSLCFKNCPVNAIVKDGNIYKIIQEKCTKCGLCQRQCPFDAIIN